jgi:hypothetical protein
MEIPTFETLKCCERGCKRVINIVKQRETTCEKVNRILKEQNYTVGYNDIHESDLISALLNAKALEEFRQRIFHLLRHINVLNEEAEASADEMRSDLSFCKSIEDINEVGKKWNQIFKDLSYTQRVDTLMMDRNAWVADQISAHLEPGTVLDHDSGDSYVAKFIALNRPDVEIHTQDSFDCRQVTNMPFTLYDYNEKRLPYEDGKFDQSILATVLHHCDDPEKMFDEVVRVTKEGGGVIILENVFRNGSKVERSLNIIFDWFFNAILHETPLPLPFQHFCPEQWEYFIEKKGLRIIKKFELGKHVGIPLDHILYVTQKT